MQDHGAIGDGTAYDTATIQAAIDACTKNKDGGVVIFDEEKQYLTGQVVLKDGVRLRLPKSATILAGSKVRGSHTFASKPWQSRSAGCKVAFMQQGTPSHWV